MKIDNDLKFVDATIREYYEFSRKIMSWFVLIRNYRMYKIFCSYNFMFWLWSHFNITEFRQCENMAEANEYINFFNYGGK